MQHLKYYLEKCIIPVERALVDKITLTPGDRRLNLIIRLFPVMILNPWRS